MALNQLQYMSLSMLVIKYDDIRRCLHNGAKDQDISPFTAVDMYDINDPILLQKCSPCSGSFACYIFLLMRYFCALHLISCLT